MAWSVAFRDKSRRALLASKGFWERTPCKDGQLRPEAYGRGEARHRVAAGKASVRGSDASHLSLLPWSFFHQGDSTIGQFQKSPSVSGKLIEQSQNSSLRLPSAS